MKKEKWHIYIEGFDGNFYYDMSFNNREELYKELSSRECGASFYNGDKELKDYVLNDPDNWFILYDVFVIKNTYLVKNGPIIERNGYNTILKKNKNYRRI